MPALAFAYGSFGDILATGQLIVKIIVILRRGAQSDECAETEKELKSLGSDLANLTRMPDDAVQASPLAWSVADRIQEEIRRCHRLMVHFFSKMNATSGGLFQRLMWAASEERELATFRMRIIERRTALGVVVGMLNSGMLLAVQDRVIEQHTQLEDTVMNGVNSLAQQLATYQQQIVAVVRRVSRGVMEDLFVVISPAGVSIPIPLVYCPRYSDLVRILDAYFDGKVEAPFFWMIESSGNFVPEYDSNLNFVSPEGPKASMQLDIIYACDDPLVAWHVWFRSQCARCGSPLGEQALKCQVRLSSHCESFAQLTDKAIWRFALYNKKSIRRGKRPREGQTRSVELQHMPATVTALMRFIRRVYPSFIRELEVCDAGER
ncbi:hypothetical protein B0H16DRAFT_1694425 [Mycena metata]|uniref:Fungal N-terminal domain-containing protein n=1 Tax=Mycena metata TaxID=1033252 RepID=A0AAD7IC91_9AGAR|nr:hypothetical protein B0H16DRAFT_1694425 [Mycena metata]